MQNDEIVGMARAEGVVSAGPDGALGAATGRPPVSRTNAGGPERDAAVRRRVSGLVRELRDRWSVEDLARFVTEQGIVALALMHVAGDGNLRTLDFVPRSEQHLLDILGGGERSDASSLFPEGDLATGGSDLLVQPRIETAFLEPFAAGLTMAILCSHASGDGRPFPESPDTIVRAAARQVLEVAGVELWAHGEVEFFLGRLGVDTGEARAPDSGYQAVAPLVFGEALRRRAQGLLTDMGVPVKYAHSEVGYIPAETPQDLTWEQHELELALAPLPQAADAVVLTQWVVRRLASDAGLRCSFDPVVRAGHAGNGLHFHFSPVRDGSHLSCLREDGALEEEAGWLVGGLVLMAGGLMAFGNRTQRSFDRLTEGREVPKAVRWGVSDRRALVRVPIQPATVGGRRTTAPTVEFRLPDGAAQTHLLLAAAAAAMLTGMRTEGLQGILGATRSGGSDHGRYPIPVSPAGVAEAVEASRAWLVADGIFPGGLIDRIAAALRG